MTSSLGTDSVLSRWVALFPPPSAMLLTITQALVIRRNNVLTLLADIILKDIL